MILITTLQYKNLLFLELNGKYINKVQHMFELLRYGKEQEIKSAIPYKSYDDSNIDDKEQIRDLGIMMSNTATFTLNIRNIVKKARDKMGWVLRVFQSRKRSLMLTLWKSLVIPLLEYTLPALESMKSKWHTSYLSYSTNVNIQYHWSTTLKLLGKTTSSNFSLSRDAVSVT